MQCNNISKKHAILGLLVNDARFNINGTQFDCAVILNSDIENVYVIKKESNICKCYLLDIVNSALVYNDDPDITFEGNFESNKHRIDCVYANIA